jgi:hypothetical protein
MLKPHPRPEPLLSHLILSFLCLSHLSTAPCHHLQPAASGDGIEENCGIDAATFGDGIEEPSGMNEDGRLKAALWPISFLLAAR